MDDSFSENKEEFEPKFRKLVSLIEKSVKMTVFSGAGVSTLSGIPDFRGKHGVYTDPWNGLDVEEIISIDFFRREPEIFYKWARDVWYNLENYEPNVVHRTLALLEKAGKLECVYTQNIDMLHQRAGSTVYEIHGSPYTSHCTSCGRQYGYSHDSPIVRNGKVPHCICSGVIKPDIVFYGEGLDQNILNKAFTDFSCTDLCIVLGSSLVVQPAASLPGIALKNGADIVIVNAQETYLDKYAALHFRDLRQTFEAVESFVLNNMLK